MTRYEIHRPGGRAPFVLPELDLSQCRLLNVAQQGWLGEHGYRQIHEVDARAGVGKSPRESRSEFGSE